MKIIDLTQKLYDGMKTFPGNVVGVKIKKTAESEREGYNGSQFGLLDFHVGTHIDTPKHFINEGVDLISINLNSLIGRAKIINVLNKTKITRNDFEITEIENEDIVLIYTGWSKKIGSREYFKNHPYLTLDAAKFLIEKKIKCLGIDVVNVDEYNNADFEVHKALLAKGIPIIENLTNLEKLLDSISDIIFIALPLKIKGGEASPVRAVGLIKECE